MCVCVFVCVLCVLISYYYVGQDKKSYTNGSIGQESSTFGTRKDLHKSNPSRETILSQRAVGFWAPFLCGVKAQHCEGPLVSLI